MNAEFRRDFAKIQQFHGERRSPERIRAHYLLERSLANRLKAAAPESRSKVYGEVYDELFQKLEDHPQHTKRAAPNGRAVEQTVRYLAPFLKTDTNFVEIGCGDAALSFAVARLVKSATGVDVQDNLVDMSAAPSNFRFVKLDGSVRLPFETASMDVISSDQLLEHLHPQDVLGQLSEAARILKKGGVYICTTPSAVTGPHDITMYFGYTAAGLHLKEYNYRDLGKLFQSAGFRRVDAAIRLFGRQAFLPINVMIAIEGLFMCLPRFLRAPMARTRIVDRIMGINAIARM